MRNIERGCGEREKVREGRGERECTEREMRGLGLQRERKRRERTHRKLYLLEGSSSADFDGFCYFSKLILILEFFV